MSNFNKSKGRCMTLQRRLACGLAAMFLAVAGITHASEAGEKPATVTLTVERAPLATVLKKIEAQTYYTFFFNNELVGKAAPVTLSVKQAPVPDVLAKIFAGSDLTYEFREDKILIKRKKSDKPATQAQESETAGTVGGQTAGVDRQVTPPQQKNTASAAPALVQGVVRDDTGQPVAGVSVIVKGSLVGAVTESDGSYRIKARPSDQLSFSFLGYKTQDIYVGSKTTIDVRLVSTAQAIDDVVVTALGMKREEKSLGYAATKVKSDAFSSSASSSNWMSGLSGQVAGLTVAKANTGGGGSMRVTLRGESSIDLNNNGALFVIDGVPMFNTSAAGGESTAYSIDYGNGTGDVNPEDIENITVLKGPAATALYGSEAANGAIIITTKSGEGQDGSVSVTFTSNFVVDQINSSPDFQYVYGQGSAKGNDGFHYGDPVDGEGSNTTDVSSWGPKMDGTLYYQYYDASRGIGVDENGVRIKTPFVSYGNWFKNFFQTGWTATNTLSVSGKINKNNAIRFSVTDYRSESIVPNSPWSKQSLSLKSNNKINRWLSVDTSLTYYRKDDDNLPVMGYGSSSIMYSLWCMSPNIDMNWAKQYWLPGQEHVQQDAGLSGGKNNPYFTAYEQLNTLDRDRMYGNTALNLHLYKGLDLMLRGGIDFSRDLRSTRHPKSSYSYKYGMYSEQELTSLQLSTDFLLKYDRKLGAGFNITANLGGSIINRSFVQTSKTAEQLKQPGVYSLANSVNRIKTDNYSYERQTNSIYGLISLSWRDAVYLDITGRNDWSSTLPVSNNSYFYPSVSASVLLNELIDFGSARNVVNLVKLRGSFAQVGNDTKPYRTSNYLTSSDFAGNFQIPRTAADLNLKPEIVSSWEVGADIRLFQSRLNLDIAYYDSESKNQIVSMPVSQASGVGSRYSNTGRIRNWGWEVSVNGTIVKNKKVQWKAYVNWALNRNRVLELGDGVDSWIVASYSSHAYMTAYEGQSLSTMYGLGYKRAPEGSFIVGKDGSLTDVSGQLVIDENGYPQYSDDLQRIGECMPDWKGGFGTSVKWNGLTLSVAFDGQFGGHVYSYSNALLGSRGKGTVSLPGRYDGLVLDGVNQLPDGNYVKNTHKTADITEYYGLAYAFQNAEQNFVSTQFLKLRELRLDYEFPKKWLSKTRIIKGLVLSVYGRDLFCWSDFPGWDPEGAFMRGSSVVPGFEIAQMPGTRAIGGSIKITF